MINELSPDIRRAIIAYAAKENLSFEIALECLVMEGFKTILNTQDGIFMGVHKVV